MPQLNPEFFVSQLFWLTIFFSLMFLFLWRISLPRIALVLENRQKKIDNDLLIAKELQEEAQNVETKINDQINKAKLDTEDQIKKTILSLEDSVSSQLQRLDKELDEKISISEKEILKNRDEQIKNIDSEIVQITKLTVSRIAKLNISDSEIDGAVKNHRGSLN